MTNTATATPNLFDELQTSYNFFSDPAHGWLRVKLDEVVKLGIAELVSEYSYIDKSREWVYLEEDCDAGLFFNAKDELKEPIKFIESFTNDDSPIRRLNRYDRFASYAK